MSDCQKPRELRLPEELLPAHGQVRVKLPEPLGLGCWAELLTADREARRATAELASGERVALLFTGEPGALYELRSRGTLREAEAALEQREERCRELRESVGRELGEPLSRSELLARVRRELPLPLGVAGSGLEAELRAEVAREREQLARYSAGLKRSQARAEEAERLYAERLGRAGEGFPAWYLEAPSLPEGGLGAELLEAARERMSGASFSGSVRGAGLELAYGDCTGEPYLWRGQLGALVFSGGGLEGERESWSSALLFLSTSEAQAYLRGLRELDSELLALELEEAAPTLLAPSARQAAEQALAYL